MAFQTVKRLLVGRPMQSERLGHTLLPKKIALPVFASDALSSVAYATQEVLLVLAAGGLALIAYTPWIALAVGLLMLVVVASYRPTRRHGLRPQRPQRPAARRNRPAAPAGP